MSVMALFSQPRKMIQAGALIISLILLVLVLFSSNHITSRGWENIRLPLSSNKHELTSNSAHESFEFDQSSENLGSSVKHHQSHDTHNHANHFEGTRLGHPGDEADSKKGGAKTHHEQTGSDRKHLEASDFDRDGGHFPSPENFHRYESHDAWRSPDSFVPTYPNRNPRPKLPSIDRYQSKGDYLQQPIVADYAEGAENIFLMIKTGASVLWKRLPVHMFTTLTRVPKFALYSDRPGSIAGHEIVDVLANVTQDTYDFRDFDIYRKQEVEYTQHMNIGVENIGTDGGWTLDKYKNVPMLAHAYSVSPTTDWFVFMDADTYLLIDTLIAYLKTLDPDEPIYLGSAAGLGAINFAHGGSGVVISRKALELSIGGKPEYLPAYEMKARETCCGDHLTSQMLIEMIDLHLSLGDQHKVHNHFQGNPVQEVEMDAGRLCQNIVSFHHLTAQDIEVLWEWEKLRGPHRKDIKYSDIYQDFHKPFIQEVIHDWDNRAETWSYSAKEDTEEDKTSGKERPYASYRACQKACNENEHCYSWRWIPKLERCQLSHSFRLGASTNKAIKHINDMEDSVSGFMVERIRKLRAQSACDPIHGKAHTDPEVNSQGEDRSEGWFSRLQKATPPRTRPSRPVSKEEEEKKKEEEEKKNEENKKEEEKKKEEKKKEDEKKKEEEKNKKEEKKERED